MCMDSDRVNLTVEHHEYDNISLGGVALGRTSERKVLQLRFQTDPFDRVWSG